MSDNHTTFNSSTTEKDLSHLAIRTIPQLVSQAAETYGEKIFLEEENTRISFKRFFEQCFLVASALIAKGVRPGDRVAVWAPNISEWVISAIGAQCAGAVLVTLNTRYKGAEAAYILQKSAAKILFSIQQFLNVDYPSLLEGEALPDLQELILLRSSGSIKISSVRAKISRWEDFLVEGSDAPSEKVAQCLAGIQADDISDILFTSGTTGNPKGVMTSHGQNIDVFSIFSDILGLSSDDRYLVINPFFHSFGYKAGILACLIKGATLLPHAVFNSGDILRRISAEKITVLPGPPTIFQSLLADPELDGYDISSLKKATTGASVIPVELIHTMRKRLGIDTVITAYGLTESCGLVTMCRAGDSAETIASTSGRAIPGIELRCVDAANREVSIGTPGEIVCRGFNVMKGYFENEAATRDCIDAEGWLHTGDIGVLDEKGNLRITDRLKDMFISGGFNCYPAEIEKILAGHEGITMNAVVGIPDERLGEVAMAFVVSKPGIALEEEELIRWCREKMANYKVPRKICFVDTLPLNASGKVLKPELRKMAVI